MQYWHANTYEDPVFGMFYEDICRAAAGGILPPEFATPEDMQRVWNSLPGASCFMSKGAGIRLSRWWSWHDRQEEVQYCWRGLVVLGLERVWWPNIWETPIERLGRAPPVDNGADEVTAPMEVAGQEELMSVKVANDKIEQSGGRTRRTRSTSHARCSGMSLSAGLAGGCDTSMQTAKSFDSTLELALASIGRECNMTLRDTARQIFTPSVLVDLCFTIGFDDPNLVSDDALLAEKLFWYTISLIGSQLTFLTLRSDSLPWISAALLDADKVKRGAALARLKRLWGLLCEYESRSGDHCVQSFLGGLL